MEEYIKKLLEQVRFEKAHKAISDEIRAHIEDQAEAHISEGMDKETAEKRAVEDMGDPVETGIALDKVHRPQVAWSVVVATLVVAVLGIVLRVFMERTGYFLHDERFIKATIIGIILMLLLYFIDYTTVAKYSKVVGYLLLMAFVSCRLAKILLYDSNVDNVLSDYNYVLMKSIYMVDILRPLIIPLFAGIIYKYRGQRNKGIIKAICCIIITFVAIYSGKSRDIEWSILIIGMLAELTIAVIKGWIEVKKKPVLISMWSALGLFFVHHIYRLKAPLSSIYTAEDEMIRRHIKAAKLLGDNCNLGGYGVNIFTIAITMGIVIAIAIAAVIIGLIVIGVMAVSKTKNQLGGVMAAGCLTWLTANTVFNILSGFGIIPDPDQSSFLPFISGELTFEGLIASYAMLGIILSIYKYKNAYPKHVDIRIRSNIKVLSRNTEFYTWKNT